MAKNRIGYESNMRDLFNLDSRVAVVVGGNGYLGKEFCKSLLEHGAVVYCCDASIKESEETNKLRSNFSDKFTMIETDATNKESLENLKNNILTTEKTVDILVNAATMKGNDFYLPFEEV